jgi:hypothetical protein
MRAESRKKTEVGGRNREKPALKLSRSRIKLPSLK